MVTLNAHPVLMSVAEALIVLFATSLAGLLAMAGGNLARLRVHIWFRRWCTWTVVASVVLGALWLGGAVAVALVALLAWQSAREAARLLRLGTVYRRWLVGAAPLTVVAAAVWPAALPWLPGVFALVLVTVVLPAQAGIQARATRWIPACAGVTCLPNIGRAVFGFVWAPWLLGWVVRLGTLADGVAWVVTLGLAVALADVAACVIGSRVGGPKLAPRISPGKTWSGLLGAVLGAYLAFALLTPIRPSAPAPVVWVLPLVVAVAGILGDLLESRVKRAAGVKDAGDWLPGFGGLLDRLDSALLALPVAYCVLRMV